MTAFLDDFDKDVLLAHDTSTCHWTKWDEFTMITKVRNRKGPCNCPSATPCKPHGCYSCASTKDVLDKHPTSEKRFKETLDKLFKALELFQAAIAAVDEVLDSEARNGRNPEDALKGSLTDTRIRDILNGHLGSSDFKAAIRLVLGLKIKRRPVDTKPEADCDDCGECFDNKVARLEAEKKQIQQLIDAADESAPKLSSFYDKWKPKFSNTLWPVLQGCWNIVSGIMSEKYGKALDGAKQLGKYVAGNASEGGDLYTFVKALYRLGRMQADAMVGIIFHDRQAASPTCGGHKLVVEVPDIPGEEEQPTVQEIPTGPVPASESAIATDVPDSHYLESLPDREGQTASLGRTRSQG